MAWKGRRILLVGYYPPPLGGESVHVRELARRLMAEGVPIQVVNSRRGAPPSSEYRTISGPLGFFQDLLESLGPDTMLHLHTNGHNGKSWLMILAAAIALRLRQAAGILTLHSGLSPEYLVRAPIHVRLLVRAAADTFAHIICVNEEIRRALEGLGVGWERLSVIPAFLGIREAPSLSQPDREVAKLMKPLIVAMGGVEPEYGLPLLVGVLPALSHNFPSFGCIIIGSDGGDRVQTLLTDARLLNHVVCLGQISHDRCLSLLSSADVFVRASYTDGDSIAVREALALGTPVVASDTKIRPSGVILFQRGDSADLIAKINYALKIGRSVRAHVHKPGSSSLDRLLDVYHRVNRTAVSTGGTP
jgi:glycogen(starch) synthase